MAYAPSERKGISKLVSMNALELIALTEKQQEEVQVSNNKNLVRRTVGAKRTDRRRMDELIVDVGVKESFKKKLVGIMDGHVERMGDVKMTKRADAQKMEGEMWR